MKYAALLQWILCRSYIFKGSHFHLWSDGLFTILCLQTQVCLFTCAAPQRQLFQLCYDCNSAPHLSAAELRETDCCRPLNLLRSTVAAVAPQTHNSVCFASLLRRSLSLFPGRFPAVASLFSHASLRPLHVASCMHNRWSDGQTNEIFPIRAVWSLCAHYVDNWSKRPHILQLLIIYIIMKQALIPNCPMKLYNRLIRVIAPLNKLYHSAAFEFFNTL